MANPAHKQNFTDSQLGVRELLTPRLRHLVAVPPPTEPDIHIPDPPEALVRALATRAYEVVQGLRNIAQLGPSVTVGATRQLLAQRAALTELHSFFRDPHLAITRVGGSRICRLQSQTAEASVVIHTDRRTCSVALRLEWLHGHWRASELHVI